jgi:hypothetical protein
MDTVESQTIKKCYEELNMTPDMIADDRQLDIVAVKGCLMNCSASYRKACKVEPENNPRLNFNDDQLERANQVIEETMLGAETADGFVDWKTRLQAAIYIRDDKKGRKEAGKMLGNTQNNVLQINNILQQARATAQQAIESIKPAGQLIESQ